MSFQQRYCAPFKSPHHRNRGRFRVKLQLALYMLYCHDRRHRRYDNSGDCEYEADDRQTSPINTHTFLSSDNEASPIFMSARCGGSNLPSFWRPNWSVSAPQS
jgi:hypothetical protein